MDAQATARLRENLARVRARIAAAAERAGRLADEVRLVAVTKSVPAEAARALVEAGAADLAENRVDGLREKEEALAGLPVRWHMIGHLQRNKVKKLLDRPRLPLLHSLDGDRLADELRAALVARGPGGGEPLRALVQVNVSGEGSKGGFAPAEVPAALDRLAGWPELRVEGFMTMAPLEDDPERARPHFRALRALRDRERARHPALAELSMGMSGDFEVAVEEGATIVRVGTALFSGVA